MDRGKEPDGHDKREAVFRGMYLGGDESRTSWPWLQSHVCRDHGPLGAIYPRADWTAPNPHKALKEGDTPSWFYFLPNGLSDPERPQWGCWGGVAVYSVEKTANSGQIKSSFVADWASSGGQSDLDLGLFGRSRHRIDGYEA